MSGWYKVGEVLVAKQGHVNHVAGLSTAFQVGGARLVLENNQRIREIFGKQQACTSLQAGIPLNSQVPC